MEQAFVAVDRISNGTIEGRIWSAINLVSGYKYRDAIRVKEKNIIDWLISKPDGSEEGNFVGRFLDQYKPKVSK